jgi:hypothetical protein
MRIAVVICVLLLTGCPGDVVDRCAAVSCSPGRICRDGRCVPESCVPGSCPPGTRCVYGLCASGVGDGAVDGARPADLRPDQPGQPDAFVGPTCGDKACEGAESCVSCPQDCGDCPCQPGQTGASTIGCNVCERKLRDCLPDGQWGPWQPCKSACVNGNTCNGSRCESNYEGAVGNTGPYCGYVTGAGSYSHVFCKPGDFCVDEPTRACRGYQTPLLGDPYHGYANATGGPCGSENRFLGPTVEVRCHVNSPCVDFSKRVCQR